MSADGASDHAGTPRAFMARWGLPAVRRITVGTTPTVVLQPDPDRYLALLWAADAAVRVWPGLAGAGSDPAHIWAGSEPLVLSHGSIGAAVCLPWSMAASAGTATLVLVEGRMRAGTVGAAGADGDVGAGMVGGATDSGLSVALAGTGIG